MAARSRHFPRCRVASAGLRGRLKLCEDIRTEQSEKHQAGVGNPVIPPLGDGTGRNFANARYFYRSAEFVNDSIGIHAQYLSSLRLRMQAI